MLFYGGLGAYTALVLVNWLPRNDGLRAMPTERSKWRTVMAAKAGGLRVLHEDPVWHGTGAYAIRTLIRDIWGRFRGHGQ